MANSVAGLGAAIDALRQEIMHAMLYGHGVGIQFKLEEIELTLQTAIAIETSGTVSWQVLGIGSSRQTATTQTLHLKLTPEFRREDGSEAPDFRISGPKESAKGTAGPKEK